MPALTTILTDKPGARSRSASPIRPPMSPITPPLAPAQPRDVPPAAAELPPARQTYTHSSQPSQQIGIPPPPPEPIDFEQNPDVIALKSAISVLQVQKRRATGDIQTLNRIKDEALDDPESFMKDLAAGKVKPRDDCLFESVDSDEHDGDTGGENSRSKRSSRQDEESKPREWSSLPKPQDVVRCPPLNWAQYAVVGESLDKLHAEQVARPSQGLPAVFGPNGMYDIKTEGKQEKYTGVAAPYAPAKDRIDRKSKGKK
ncbi:uncharacterized protein MAM_07682 [Metarhizium album ARSEF 1941]|uniref:Uncharacterized protein n=1 Tax=Metarhizium album (strain ARSEF 1941) TaxID=1081103 RepID=A0A0B2WLC0_METAS|nr:uncharacterized protein MAM_07682 [Metarhizium album ARSEF 1941]KHN94494.1 hypothetical protein MAM_07682 [Metarhizium album ARSEF 1941]